MPVYEVTLVPAYGRDYTSVADVKRDWDAGKDFYATSYKGTLEGYTSKRDWKGKYVAIRYKKLTQIAILKG